MDDGIPALLQMEMLGQAGAHNALADQQQAQGNYAQLQGSPITLTGASMGAYTLGALQPGTVITISNQTNETWTFQEAYNQVTNRAYAYLPYNVQTDQTPTRLDALYGIATMPQWTTVGAGPATTAERKAAEERAEALLLSLLTPKQQLSWKAKDRFIFTGQSGKPYCIKRGWSMNVEDAMYRYCAQISDFSAPPADNVIGQMMALRFREAEFLAAANRVFHFQVPAWTKELPSSKRLTGSGRRILERLVRVWRDLSGSVRDRLSIGS